MTQNLWGLVLAGGDGTRLQELTRIIAGAPIPKQYCRILGTESLLEATLARVRASVPPERTLVVVNRDHLDIARGQLTSIPEGNVIVQPCNRDTGPGIASALVELARRAPDASLAVFPSDHYVANERGFADSVARMTAVLAKDPRRVVLLGIRPDQPDTGLGYIVPEEERRLARTGCMRVARFEEKPAPARAEAIIRKGALWSSFIMMSRLRRLLYLLRQARPRELEALERLPSAPVARQAAYRTLPPWNFSHGFLQQSARHLVAVCAEDLGWSDWGTREAIERTLASLGMTPAWMQAAHVRAA